MSATQPPPIAPDSKLPRPRLQFNTATLLGIMALVAVACAVGVTMPTLFAFVVAWMSDAILVAYGGFLLAGVWLAGGNRRLFCFATLGCLVLVTLASMRSTTIGPYFLDRGGLSPAFAYFVWSLLTLAERVLLSLLGGWIALRAATFWQADSPGGSAES